MHSEAKISIIIPAWNAEKYIGETIECIMNQDWVNIEILVIDNASEDETISVLKAINDSRIQVIELKENKGASHARNIGLQLATGEYIQYLDADDLLSPNKFHLQYQALQNYPNALAFGNVCFFWDVEDAWSKNPEPNESFYYSSTEPLTFLLNLYGQNGTGGMIPIHSWFCSRSLLQTAGDWNEGLTVDDDGEYFCRVVLSAERLIFTPQVNAYYRKYRNRKSLSREQTHNSMRSSFLATELKYQECKRLATESDEVEKVFARHYMELADITWPEFPDLTKMALRRVAALGGSEHIPHIGNPMLNKLKYIFGWKNMKWISWKKNQLFKKG
jgi:glycosyltransferase involved in cell wall biosynthesis